MNGIIQHRDYQAESVLNTLKALDSMDRVAVCLPTGAGKSIVISSIAHNLNGRVLILVHRREILEQNAEWLDDVFVLDASSKFLKKTRIVIAMVETFNSRIKKHGHNYMGKFDSVIADECHILVFDKVFRKLEVKKMIGFTATPVINKKRRFEVDGVEFSQEIAFSDFYQKLIQSVDTQDLIDRGFLVQERNVELLPHNFENLKASESQPDGFTKDSLDEVYSSTASLEILKKSYEDYGVGRKTIIFNANSSINLKVYKMFKDMGVECMFFDSVNSEHIPINEATGKKYTRDEVVDWYKNTKDGLLINVSVFTTGFNVKDIGTVIVNRATKSLSLWLQIVGRGSRTTDKFYKDFFYCIDLGGNIQRHDIWSGRRDWQDYFYPKSPKPKKKLDIIQTWDCNSCFAINIVGETVCSECGEERLKSKVTKAPTTGKLVQRPTDLKPPSGVKIIEYCKRVGKGKNDAFKILESKIIELFRFYEVSQTDFLEKQDSYEARVIEIFRKAYHPINSSSLFGKYRRFSTMQNQLLTKIRESYGVE